MLFLNKYIQNFKHVHARKQSGFTLVELLVVVAIISVISGIVYQNSDKFSDVIGLQSVAEDVTLAAREAQTYGVSVKDSTGSGDFSVGYGIVFNIANPTYAMVFADANGNDIYDGDGTTNCNDGANECVDKVLLRDGVTITSICGINTAGSTICSRTYQAIQATFLRPSLNAAIVITNSAGIAQAGSWQAAQIILTSPKGAKKTILISTTGLISVQ